MDARLSLSNDYGKTLAIFSESLIGWNAWRIILWLATCKVHTDTTCRRDSKTDYVLPNLVGWASWTGYVPHLVSVMTKRDLRRTCWEWRRLNVMIGAWVEWIDWLINYIITLIHSNACRRDYLQSRSHQCGQSKVKLPGLMHLVVVQTADEVLS